jgi:hypothetical protein
MKRTRLTREEILSAGSIFAHDGESGSSGTGDQGSDGGQGNGSTGGAGQADADKDKKDDDSDTGDPKDDDLTGLSEEQLKRKLKHLQDEKDRHYARRTEAERERDELKAKEEERARKGRSELENAKADVEARDKQIIALNETVKRLTVENAFVSLKEIEWHNPATALRLVDLSEVEFDEKTGKVKDPGAVLKAAKALADENQYLVKSKTAAPAGTPQGKPTGKPPAGGKSKDTTDEELRKKYNIQR